MEYDYVSALASSRYIELARSTYPPERIAKLHCSGKTVLLSFRMKRDFDMSSLLVGVTTQVGWTLASCKLQYEANEEE